VFKIIIKIIFNNNNKHDHLLKLQINSKIINILNYSNLIILKIKCMVLSINNANIIHKKIILIYNNIYSHNHNNNFKISLIKIIIIFIIMDNSNKIFNNNYNPSNNKILFPHKDIRLLNSNNTNHNNSNNNNTLHNNSENNYSI